MQKLIFLIVIGFQTAAHAEYPIKAQILNFGGTSHWQATQTILTPTTSGRFRSEYTQAANIIPRKGEFFCRESLRTLTWKSLDFVSEFQKRPLEVMFENGYISEDMHSELSKLSEKVDARQLLLITLFSEIPESEADLLIEQGLLAPTRVMTRNIPKKRGWVRVSRATVFAIRGQIFDPSKSGPLEFEPLKVAWQHDKLGPMKLEEDINREKVPNLVEVGRLHSEKDVLEGDLNLATTLVFQTLGDEFRIFKIPPEQVVVTGHFLDWQHVLGFLKKYPLRILDAEKQRALENNPSFVLQNYLSERLPKGREEWSQNSNRVTFGSLKELIGNGPPVEEISEAAFQIKALSNGRVNPELGAKFFSDYLSLLREDFNYDFPGYGRTPAPLMTREKSITTAGRVFDMYKALGISLGTTEFDNIKKLVETTNMNYEPDALLQPWIDPKVTIRYIDLKTSGAMVPALDIGNLDPKLAQQFPQEYLASIILSFADLIRSRIDRINPSAYKYLVIELNKTRAQKNLPPTTDLNLAAVIDVFPISMIALDSGIEGQLRALQGTSTNAVGFGYKFTQSDDGRKVNISMDVTDQVHIYDFKGPQIAWLTEHFPQYAINARRRLDPANYATRLKLLNNSQH